MFLSFGVSTIENQRHGNRIYLSSFPTGFPEKNMAFVKNKNVITSQV